MITRPPTLVVAASLSCSHAGLATEAPPPNAQPLRACVMLSKAFAHSHPPWTLDVEQLWIVAGRMKQTVTVSRQCVRIGKSVRIHAGYEF